MRRRFIILIFLLIGASVLIDLSLIRASEQYAASHDLHDTLRVLAAAFALVQTNLATLCFGLCTLPWILRVGGVIAIGLVLVWLVIDPGSDVVGPLREVTVIAAESLIASWLLKFAGYLLLVPGDALPNTEDHQPRYRFTLSNLFGLTSIVAIASFVIRDMMFGTNPIIVGLVLPSFLLSIILTMWSVLSADHVGKRYGITLAVQVVIFGIYFVFGPRLVPTLWVSYCVLAFGYAVLLRVMEMRLHRFRK